MFLTAVRFVVVNVFFFYFLIAFQNQRGLTIYAFGCGLPGINLGQRSNG